MIEIEFRHPWIGGSAIDYFKCGDVGSCAGYHVRGGWSCCFRLWGWMDRDARVVSFGHLGLFLWWRGHVVYGRTSHGTLEI